MLTGPGSLMFEKGLTNEHPEIKVRMPSFGCGTVGFSAYTAVNINDSIKPKLLVIPRA